MTKFAGRLSLGVAIAALTAVPAVAQVKDFKPVTAAQLANPDPADWLLINRTYDQQRYSPLKQINKGNVGQLKMAWSRGLTQGTQESTPIVRNGTMYVFAPGGGIMALDGTNGDLKWEYWRQYPKDMTQFIGSAERSRSKSLSIWEDMIFFDAPDGFIVALDAVTGKVRWETKAHDYKDKTQHSGGTMVADGKVISNRTCDKRVGCFIAAHDAKTGKELWKFYTTAAQGEPGGETWGDVPTDKRVASSWGLPGSYDPVRRLTIWSIANPKPYTRLLRHGSAEGTSPVAPADLFSNSTVAINVDTGKLAWYFQHLPGDDWDADHIHERTLVRTRIAPDPKHVKWINPAIKKGEVRDVAVSVGEAGGLYVMDRSTGQFLWGHPFPMDVPNFHLSGVDVATGKTHINMANVFKKDGDKMVGCFHNVRSWWSTAYHPGQNALYVPGHDQCLTMTANAKNPEGWGPRNSVLRPGADIEKFTTLYKIDLATGKMTNLYQQRAPGNGSALTTGGDLVFWGDMNRRLRAFDAGGGKVLWEGVVGGMIMASTITYQAKGKQYVAVLTGDGQSGTAGPLGITKMPAVRGHNAVYVFALP